MYPRSSNPMIDKPTDRLIERGRNAIVYRPAEADSLPYYYYHLTSLSRWVEGLLDFRLCAISGVMNIS